MSHPYQTSRDYLDTLDRYAKALDAAGDPRQISLFGDEKPDALTLWQLAANYKAPALAKGTTNPDRRKRDWKNTREAVLDALGSVEGQYIHRRAQAAKTLEDAVAVVTENLRTGGTYSTDGRSWEGTAKGLRVHMGESEAIVPWKQIAQIARDTSLEGQDISPSPSLPLSQ